MLQGKTLVTKLNLLGSFWGTILIFIDCILGKLSFYLFSSYSDMVSKYFNDVHFSILGVHNIFNIIETLSKRHQIFFLIFFHVNHICNFFKIDTIGYQMS